MEANGDRRQFYRPQRREKQGQHRSAQEKLSIPLLWSVEGVWRQVSRGLRWVRDTEVLEGGVVMIGINCSSCGKFVGTDGRIDVGYDPYSGCMEAGYPLCGKCLSEEEAGLKNTRRW